MVATASPIYSDLQALSGLRAEARQAPDQSLEKVASQFESLFVQMMLKSMRDAIPKGDLFDSNQMEMSQQMFDQQISLDLSQKGGLGLAEVLVEQLRGGITQTDQQQSGDPQAATVTTPSQLGRQSVQAPIAHEPIAQAPMAIETVRARLNRPELQPAQESAATATNALDRMGVAKPWQPQTPQEFIEGVWQHAVDAAQRIGVNPEVLVAQSALETGWGKKVIKDAQGESSLNLFNIKADSRWQGPAASVKTLEYRDGVAVQERASFRAYDSIKQSFDDYVDFLQGNPRYHQALKQSDGDSGFLKGLQQAGYATDPDYADKIRNVLDGSSFSSVVNGLKNSANLPL